MRQLPTTGRETARHVYYAATRGLCAVCLAQVDVKVQLRDGSVYHAGYCPEHGHQEACVASSADWYLAGLAQSTPAEPPETPSTAIERGCPHDCGPCPLHAQRPHLRVPPGSHELAEVCEGATIAAVVSDETSVDQLSAWIRQLSSSDAAVLALRIDPDAALTIPDLHASLATASDGLLTASDFIPSPIAHPHCFSLAAIGSGELRALHFAGAKTVLIHAPMSARRFDVARAVRCTLVVVGASGGETPWCLHQLLRSDADPLSNRRPRRHGDTEERLTSRPNQLPVSPRQVSSSVSSPSNHPSPCTSVSPYLRCSRVSGNPPVSGSEAVHSHARAMCPTCRRLVDGLRILRDGRVYLRRHCPEHGPSEGLISGDADWFLRSLTCIKPGSIPLGFSKPVERGCPDDCGLCPDHEQHTCLPIIEVTDHCNLACPICLVRNRNRSHLTTAEFAAIIDGLVEKEGTLDSVNLSGGEPTVHPQFLELLDIAQDKPGVTRVSVSTNGVRLAADPGLCEELARRRVYVSLQLDSLDPDVLRSLRGRDDLAEVRREALANLERAGVPTTIITTVVRGVNDHCVGESVRLLLEHDFILSLMFQPAAYTGSGGGSFARHDPLDVVTIPDVVHAIEEQTEGLLLASDFYPLPCSHPSCFALTYLLHTEDGRFVPFPRFVELERYLDMIANRGTIEPDERFEDSIRDTIDQLWSTSGRIPDTKNVLRTLKRLIRQMYPPERVLELEERLRIGEAAVKTIFIHAFMDEHSFDLERLRKCCNHYALPDGRMMPSCSYNTLHRGRPS